MSFVMSCRARSRVRAHGVAGFAPQAWVSGFLALLASVAVALLLATTVHAQDAEEGPEGAVEEQGTGVALELGGAGPLIMWELLSEPVLNHVQLSPSGRYLSYEVRHQGRGRLYLRDLETGERVSLMDVGEIGDSQIMRVGALHWKNDESLVVEVLEQRYGIIRTGSSLPMLIDPSRNWRRDDYSARGFLLFRPDGTRSLITSDFAIGTDRIVGLASVLRGQSDEIIITVTTRTGHVGTRRVNIHTGQHRMQDEGVRYISAYHIDANGQVVGRIRGANARGDRSIIERRGEDGRWHRVANISRRDLEAQPELTILGPTDSPGEFFVIRRPDDGVSGTSAVHRYDFTTGSLGPSVYAHPVYDADAIMVSSSGEFLAGCYWADVYRCDFANPETAQTMAGLHRFFEDERNIRITSQSRDNARWVLSVSGPDEPGTYYLYDRNRQQVELIGNAYPALAMERMGVMRRIDYTARDGTRLFGYLTEMPGASAPRPLVVLPHGGPEVRDHYDYDLWVQFLASRGYAVFQPQFRGSSGFGRDFARAGYGQWGALMQDDVTDGVMHLVNENLVDGDAMCIMGASYGGYVALWAGATQQSLYRCVISIAGVSDPVAIQQWERRTYGEDSTRFQYWAQSLGHPVHDRERLESISPIRHVDRWSLPTLLIHGRLDGVVPIEQSESMARALRRAGHEVETVWLSSARHSRWRYPDQNEAFAEIERFLFTHIPPPGWDGTMPEWHAFETRPEIAFSSRIYTIPREMRFRGRR
jgi:alpha-beta hydrolase superfamily lysophospholipase